MAGVVSEKKAAGSGRINVGPGELDASGTLGMAEAVVVAEGSVEVARVAELLGGRRVLRRTMESPLDAHDALEHGLPSEALVYMVERLKSLGSNRESLEKAVGMSLRTFQRRRDAGSKPLSQEQSARTWKFAEILNKATEVFGSQQEAERWMEQPAIALEQRRPIDLLTTPAGVELVEDLLVRLEYGVYA
jgi:putative toxin-antitoxin system antitoxin component (TIGR02293 family)